MDCRHPTEAAGAIGRLARIFVPPPVALDPLAIGVTAPEPAAGWLQPTGDSGPRSRAMRGPLVPPRFSPPPGPRPSPAFRPVPPAGADCSGVDLSRDDTGLRAAKFHRNGVLAPGVSLARISPIRKLVGCRKRTVHHASRCLSLAMAGGLDGVPVADNAFRAPPGYALAHPLTFLACPTES